MKRTITTSKQLFFTFAVGIALLAAGCANEESTQAPPQQEKDSSTLVDLGNVKLDISELPFGADTEGETRTEGKAIATDTIGLCNGIEAEVSLEREQLPATRTVKQGLSDGSYRLAVYQSNTFKKQIGFTVSGGKITHLERLALPTGTYDFYCCNDKVQFDEPQNKFRVEFDNAATGLIGSLKNVHVSGVDQTLNFPMKHVGARVKTRLTALMPFPSDVQAKLVSVPNGALGDMVYDIPTGVYSATKLRTLDFPTSNYTAVADVYDPGLKANLYARESSEYRYVLQNTTLTNLMLHFTSTGELYRKAMNAYGSVRISSSKQYMLAGHSYVLRVKLRTTFRYLFQDGTVGYLRDKGNRMPVALVLNRHLGIALTDSHIGTDYVPSYTSGGVLRGNWSVTGQQDNDHFFPLTDWNATITTATSGAHWTWAPTGTFNHTNPAYNGSKGDKREIYPAFYWADAYREEMKTKCTNEGKAFDSNLLTQKGRWFLPSVNEWMQLLKNVGFSNPNSLFAPGGGATGSPIEVWYNILIVRQAFVVAGGAPLWDDTDPQGRYYWTSTEGSTPDKAYIITTRPDWKFFLSDQKKNLIGFLPTYTKAFRVRAFVTFSNTAIHPHSGGSTEDGWGNDPDTNINGDDVEIDL